MSDPAATAGFLAVRPPALSVGELARFVEARFALSGRYSPLVSERDQNFRLQTDNGDQYVVKVSNAREAIAVTGLQVELLRHLQKSDLARTPAVIATTSGDCSAFVEHNSQPHSVRVVSYLDGAILATVAIDAALARDFGMRLAQLDQALRSFSSASEIPFSYWDLQRAHAIAGLRHHIADPAVAELVASVLDEFNSNIAPRLHELPKQAIHGDANPENVLVDEHGRGVTGFIDFGDTVFAPRIVDIAIAASYLRAPAPAPVRLIEPMLSGYQSISLLEPIETELLAGLIRTRLATTITMLYWRLTSRPEDDPYRQKTLSSEQDAVDFLRALQGVEFVSTQ